MKASITFVAIALSAVAEACAAFDINVKPLPLCGYQPVATIQIQGTVRDSSGAPIKGAEVLVGTTCAWRAVTDDRGRYVLTAGPVGAVTARAERAGYLDQVLTIRTDPWQQKVALIDFVLAPRPVDPEFMDRGRRAPN